METMRYHALATLIVRLMTAATLLALVMVLGTLAWSAPRLGPAMLGTATFPLFLGLALYLALAVTATVLAWRCARQLVEVDAGAARLSRTDPLTGLPNRLAFFETLGETLRRTQRPCALLEIDVNGFKRINDSVGHGGGDALIQLLGEELRRHLPDGAWLARMAGDEFAVIFSGENAGEQARAYCAALSAALERSFAIEGRSFMLSVAMGYAVAPPGRLSTGEFMRRADLAMSEAKSRRMARPMQYDPSLEHDAPHQLKIEQSLRFTMDRAGGLQVHYQPICDAVTGQMVMAEALLRWTSPELGRVSPVRFIPVAESSGLIVDLGYRLIDQVCRDLKTWPQLQVSINVSPAQLREACFIDKLTAIIERHGVAPGRIEIELTEGLLVETPDMAAFKLDNLREAGHRIALDDFGTGFSSIGYLRRMNFDKLKIDKSFVADIGVRPSAENLLQSMSLLARSLRLATVAEGVESIDQVARLRAMGFDLLQGHHFGLAVSIDDLKATFGSRVTKVRP